MTREQAIAAIVAKMPGCSLPDCRACRNNRQRAAEIVDEIIEAVATGAIAPLAEEV